MNNTITEPYSLKDEPFLNIYVIIYTCWYDYIVKQETTKNIGDLGESIACRSLEGRGYEILDRNYRKKYGEIDIVAEKDEHLYFIEVKSINKPTWKTGGFRPEDNVHPHKLRRISKAVETYLLEKRRNTEEWFFLVAVVIIDEDTMSVTVRYIEDVVPER
jgi:putative endonuclease